MGIWMTLGVLGMGDWMTQRLGLGIRLSLGILGLSLGIRIYEGLDLGLGLILGLWRGVLRLRNRLGLGIRSLGLGVWGLILGSK